MAEFTQFTAGQTRGAGFGQAASGDPWLYVGPGNDGHPEGAPDQLWAMRRYTLNASSVPAGATAVSYNVNWDMTSTNIGGRGTTMNVFQNGSLIATGATDDDAAVPVYNVGGTVNLTATNGDIFDFALTPEDNAGDTADGSDGADFGGTITRSVTFETVGIIADTTRAPSGPTLDCCAWRNHFDHIVISLDATPLEVGASVSLVGTPTVQGDEQLFANTGLISIDRETVAGGDARAGSRPIYGATDDRENQLRYFADAAVFTLAHEATHLYIDQRNSMSAVANRIWDGRNFVNASYVSAEEVVANFTACEALSGSLSAEMSAFNAQVTTTLRSYEGVDDRLDDLRTYSLAGAERLRLTAGTDCGG